MTDSHIVDEAASVLSPKHIPATYNQYGSVATGGYQATPGRGGTVRVSHATQHPDLMDDDRPSDDELDAARHRMVDAYAKTLEAAGWRVERRWPHSRRPYLLASR